MSTFLKPLPNYISPLSLSLSLSFSLCTAATWGAWGGWSDCSSTCRGGIRSRTRHCVNGNTCTGLNVEYEACNTETPCQRKYTVCTCVILSI